MSKFISLSGLKTLLEPLIHLINKKAERLDWNENDLSSLSYIENRPFYEETCFTEYTVDVTNEFVPYAVPLPSFIDGETYNLTWDGVEYSCVAYVAEQAGVPMIGNDIVAGNAGTTGGNGEPFGILVYGGENLIFAETAGTHTLGINSHVIHKIDEKYLPKLIGKITEEDGEIFNGAYDASLYAHAEGYATYATGINSHAEGCKSHSTGYHSHAEGLQTEATDMCSHAEGRETVASGEVSHAEGFGTIAQASYQHAEGMYNISDLTSIHIAGNGSAAKRSNAHTLDRNGNAWFAGDVYVGSTSGTNKDSGSKILATKEYVDSKVSTTTVTLLVPTTGWTENTAYSSYTQVFTVNGATTSSDIYIDCPVGANFPLIGARCLAANKITLYMSSIPTLAQNISIKLKKG